MVCRTFSQSAFAALSLAVLLSLNLSVSTAHAANAATIKAASWRADDSKLIVKGKQAPVGASVTISDAESGVVLGIAVTNDSNIWRLALKNPSFVPCSVQAETGGSTHIRAVNNVPADCGATATPPPEPAPEPPPPAPDPTGSDPVDPLVKLGEQLFFGETFNGNGRTCGTCHRAENNFTIDPAFIATLPHDDALFVAEFNTELAGLEDTTALRQFGLIRANADGFDNPTEKFVLRSVSHLFGLASSVQSNTTQAPFEMTGWSGDGAPGAGTLRDFSTGAVVQHFTKTLERIEDRDFRLPTNAELDALEAYMLSLGVPATVDLQALRLANPAAETGRVLFITEDSENGSKRAAKCNACHRNAGALTIAGINQNFDTGVENAAHAADVIGVLRPRDGGFGTQFDENIGAFGNGTFNPVPLVHAADTAPFFHNNVAATLEEAIAHYESNAFRASPEGQRLLLADSGGQELTVDVDALAAFLRVINVLENIRSAVDKLSLSRQYVTTAGIQEILTQSQVDLNDVLRVLDEGAIHESVVPHISDAKGLVNAAMAEPAENVAQRNGFIDLAIAEAEAGRNMMIVVLPDIDTVAPTVSITAPVTGSTVFGSVTIAAEALDAVGVSNVIFTVGQTEIGQDSSLPFEMVWNTTAFTDGENTITVTAIDPSNNSATATMTLTIDNASVAPPPDTTNPSVAITSPSAGSTVSGNVTISTDVNDDTGIASVVFSVGGSEIGQDVASPYEQVWDTTTFADGDQTIVATAFDLAGNSSSSSISVIVENSSAPPPTCTVYSCPNPPPPPSEPPPDPITPSGSSPDGEFEGEVIGIDLQASTVTVDSDGTIVTVRITTDTEFKGSVASNIAQILVGHVAGGEFFQSTSEIVWIDVDMPAGF